MDGGFMGPIEDTDNPFGEFCCKAENQGRSWQRKWG